MSQDPAPIDERAARRLARLQGPRLSRELGTIKAMVRIWCRQHHANQSAAADGLCSDCASFMDYASKRLASCPYGEEKPTCENCQIHCYGPAEREQARVMMRYAGPRMMIYHPIRAVRHLLDNRRVAPAKPRNHGSGPG
ncbi:MAG: nitrous oxide-stimulated promoter family protein [Burkholderiaceae bacterium]